MVQIWVGDSSKVEYIAQKYSPINDVTKDAPPIISIHGDSDSVIPHIQSELLHKALDEVNVKNQLVTLSGGQHLLCHAFVISLSQVPLHPCISSITTSAISN